MDEVRLQHFLDFLYELPMAKGNFCNNILGLIHKHFGYSRLIFCPYADKSARRRRTPYSGIVGKNINLSAVKSFLSDYYKYDLFSAANLPRELRKRTVLTIGDVIPWDEYESSRYGQYMQSIGLYYQACLYLTDDSGKLASISVFHTKEEGNFDEAELELFAAIAKYVSKHYLSVCNPRRTYIHYFHRYFDATGIGAALLDSRLLVVDTNREFQEFSESIVIHGNLDNDFVFSNDTLVREKHQYAQNLVSHFGSNILNKPERIHIECFQYRFKVYSKPIAFTSPSGEVENLYLMLLVQHAKVTSKNTLDAIDDLTPRELDILQMLLGGNDNAEIADALDITCYTVKTHLQNIYRKFKVASKTDLLIRMFNEQNSGD